MKTFATIAILLATTTIASAQQSPGYGQCDTDANCEAQWKATFTFCETQWYRMNDKIKTIAVNSMMKAGKNVPYLARQLAKAEFMHGCMEQPTD